MPVLDDWGLWSIRRRLRELDEGNQQLRQHADAHDKRLALIEREERQRLAAKVLVPVGYCALGLQMSEFRAPNRDGIETSWPLVVRRWVAQAIQLREPGTIITFAEQSASGPIKVGTVHAWGFARLTRVQVCDSVVDVAEGGLFAEVDRVLELGTRLLVSVEVLPWQTD